MWQVVVLAAAGAFWGDECDGGDDAVVVCGDEGDAGVEAFMGDLIGLVSGIVLEALFGEWFVGGVEEGCDMWNGVIGRKFSYDGVYLVVHMGDCMAGNGCRCVVPQR